MGSIALNVVIHGMFVIDFGDREVTLYPPKVPKNAHVYMAGTWEREENLSEGVEYRLTGVAGRSTRPALADLNPNQIPVFRRKSIDQSLAFCSIVMPFPDLVTPLRATTAVPGQPFFTPASALYQQPSAYPEIIALSYHGASLQPLQWTPEVQGNIANLHLWAMPPAATPMGHAQQASQLINQMIGYPDLQENPVYGDRGVPILDLVPGVPGICCQEEKTLEERRTSVGANVVHRINGALDCGKRTTY